MFDEYIRDEVIPFIHANCQTPGIPISTVGASLGAYHAANTLFHYPHLVKRCYALSGIFDLRDFMGGMYDDNFYFHNPMDYMANLNDPWFLDQLSTCEIRLVTGSGPYEKSGYSYAMSGVLARKGIRHSPRRLGTARGPRLAVLEGQLREVHRPDGEAPSRVRDGQIELLQQVLTVGDHLLVVDPHVAVAGQDVHVGA